MIRSKIYIGRFEWWQLGDSRIHSKMISTKDPRDILVFYRKLRIDKSKEYKSVQVNVLTEEKISIEELDRTTQIQ